MEGGNRIIMRKKTISSTIIHFVLLMVMLVGFTSTAHAERTQAAPAYGYYKIVSQGGNGDGQELYYDSKASKKDLKWKNEGTVWYIDKGDYINSYCIRRADDPSYLIGVDETYIGNNDTLKVKQNVYNHVIYFFYEYPSNAYSNMSIVLYDWAGFSYSYKLNRHKSLGNDYVNLRNDSDNKNKLWKLVPVNYSKSIARTAPSIKNGKKGKLTVKWDKFRNKIKKTKVWKNAKYIEVQYSTDKAFEKNVKVKKIEKGKVNKAKAKTTLSKLKSNKTYYLRVRLIDGKGICSNWSKVIKCKTK